MSITKCSVSKFFSNNEILKQIISIYRNCAQVLHLIALIENIFILACFYDIFLSSRKSLQNQMIINGGQTGWEPYKSSLNNGKIFCGTNRTFLFWQDPNLRLQMLIYSSTSHPKLWICSCALPLKLVSSIFH